MRLVCFLIFFNYTATTEIYTLSLHDALPILTIRAWFNPSATSGSRAIVSNENSAGYALRVVNGKVRGEVHIGGSGGSYADRKSTRMNSSHANISYAVFSLKTKNTPPSFRGHV